jgi:radical SAM superfamily enzyme YgiQ (UPF0313 family)
MSDEKSLIKQSVTLLHSCIIFVAAIYVLDLFYAKGFYLGFGILPSLMVIVPLKIYVFSGMYGTLMELISGERFVFTVRDVLDNAKRYWKGYALLMSVPLLGHAFLTLFYPVFLQAMSLYDIYHHLHMAVCYLLAYGIIQITYLRPLAIPGRKIVATRSMVDTMAVLYLLQTFFYYLPRHLHLNGFDPARLTTLVTDYLYVLTYVYTAGIIQHHYPEIKKSRSYEKEIYLINPLGGGIYFYATSIFMQNYPPVFAVLKALTPASYKFREFNRRKWHDRYYAANKLVAITCFTSNCADAYRIAAEYRRRGSKVVMGGPHVTYFPEEALEYCNSVVIGEAECVWPDVVRDYENNCLKSQYLGAGMDGCYDVIHEGLLRLPPEEIRDFLETSRGCKFKCDFCTVPVLSGGRLRTRPIHELMELIKKVKTKYRQITFIDNNIYSDPAYARELFTALKPLGIQWRTQCSIDIAKNDETLRLAKESGCRGLLIGFEISEGSQEGRKGGKLAMVSRYREYARKLKKMGIEIKAHFMFGFDSDRLIHIFRSWKFCFSILPLMGAISILTPYPGTKVYEDMRRAGCITNLNWRHYGCQSLVFRHGQVNNFFLARFWPAISLLFALTASKVGILLVALVMLAMLGII